MSLALVTASSFFKLSLMVCKALRFGLEDIGPNSLGQTSINHLSMEINDLLGVVGLLRDHGVVLDVPQNDLILAKKKKVEFYLKYAEGVGTIQA